MNDAYLTRLQRSVEASQQGKLGRAARAPIRLLRSRALQTISVIGRRPIQVHTRTFWGEGMKVVLPEVVSSTILECGFFEEALTRMILEQLRPGMVFFDIGAHFGYFSLLASAILGPSGEVHAFEPSHSTYTVLRSNVSRHRNIHLNNAALFSRDAALPFNEFGVYLSAFNSLHGIRMDNSVEARFRFSSRKLRTTTYVVDALSVDSYVARTGAAPGFVKIDAESGEYDILIGMQRTLERHRPILTVEVGDMGVEGVPSSKELAQWLIERGYCPFDYDDGAIKKHQVKERYGYGNLLFLPR